MIKESIHEPPLAPEMHPVVALEAENRILELATRNVPLEQVLELIALSAEKLVGGDVDCSILLLDGDGHRLSHGAAPNLPADYNRAIHGLVIGHGVGSCGTAAYSGREVVVADIASHPYWVDFKELALGHGLRACWSTPILSSKGKVLGTFAMYYKRPAEPDAGARKTVELLTRTAALVIERTRLVTQLDEQSARNFHTEAELVRSRDAFRRAQHAANIGSWVWDIPSGRVEFLEEVPTLRGLGGSYADWLDRVHPEDRLGVEQQLQRAMQGRDFVIECRMIVPGSPTPRWMLITGRVETVDGKPALAFGITMDLTDRRTAEQARLVAEDRFRMVLHASDIGFWYCDLPFSELIWDAKVKEHFWMDPTENVTIDSFYARLHPEDRARTRQAIETAIANRTPYDIDYRTIDPKTGEERWVRAVGRTTYGSNGAPIRFDGITIDVTERKKAEEALRSTEKLAATGRLAATIAHEINNPLEAVMNFIYLAKTHDELPDGPRRYLDVADRELARVSHIAQQTLGFYRDTTSPARVDVASVLEDVLLLYERKFGYKSLKVKRDFKHALYVEGLAGELRQVISNLVANAVDASVEEGRLLVRARQQKDVQSGMLKVRITIADEGCGMPAEVQRRLFTPFFTTKRDVGTGLGLWVSRGIVEKHAGTLKFRSRTGKLSGTMFHICLPAYRSSPVSIESGS